MSEVLPSMEELLDRAEAKGRADAIDEILKYKYCVYDDDGNGRIVVNVSNIEQIKEQKNE